MKEDREGPEGDKGEEAGVEPLEEPEIEVVEEPRPLTGREPEGWGGGETGVAGVEETESEGVGASERRVVSELASGARGKGADEEIDPSRLEGEPFAERGKDWTAEAEDSLELDRMEVRPTVGIMDEEVGSDGETGEPAAQEEGGPDRAHFLVILSRYWIWVVGFLVVITASSLALWFVSLPEMLRSLEKRAWTCSWSLLRWGASTTFGSISTVPSAVGRAGRPWSEPCRR